MAATEQQYFEAVERHGYSLFSLLAARAGRDWGVDNRTFSDGVYRIDAAYNPVRTTEDFMGATGMWDVLLRERVERLVTPRGLAGAFCPMLVYRSLTVMRIGHVVRGIIEEIIDRPVVYRFETNGLMSTEVAAAEVEFGEPECDLRNQARYVGWLGVALKSTTYSVDR